MPNPAPFCGLGEESAKIHCTILKSIDLRRHMDWVRLADVRKHHWVHIIYINILLIYIYILYIYYIINIYIYIIQIIYYIYILYILIYNIKQYNIYYKNNIICFIYMYIICTDALSRTVLIQLAGMRQFSPRFTST